MDPDSVKKEDTAISFEIEDKNLQLIDIKIEIEPADENNIEYLTDCDFKIKEDIDIGPTVLHKPSAQYQLSDTLGNTSKEQPKRTLKTANEHSKEKSSTNKSDDVLNKCNSCEKTFKNIYSLKRHQLIHLRDLSFGKRTDKILLTCPHCSEEFKHTENYNRHLREFHKETTFICDSCGKTFDKQSLLKRHQLLHSKNKKLTKKIDETLFTCTQCSVQFTHMGNYSRHVKEFHEGKSFICDNCGKTFNRYYSLKRHQISGVRCNVRTGEFTCPCGKCFTNKSNMFRHMAGYCVKKIYEGVYICDICDKAFPNRTQLMVHIGHHKRLEKTNVSN